MNQRDCNIPRSSRFRECLFRQFEVAADLCDRFSDIVEITYYLQRANRIAADSEVRCKLDAWLAIAQHLIFATPIPGVVCRPLI